MMIRTQVYLPQYQIKFLKDLALTNETTMSEELRKSLDAIRRVKSKPQKKNKVELSAGEYLLEMAKEARKLGFKGPKDLATNIDKYLYGSE